MAAIALTPAAALPIGLALARASGVMSGAGDRSWLIGAAARAATDRVPVARAEAARAVRARQYQPAMVSTLRPGRLVMPTEVGIHAFLPAQTKAWMAGLRPP